MRALAPYWLSLLVAVFLAGCEGDEPEDVRAWMNEATKDMKGKVPPLPEIKALPAISYDPGELIPPFSVEKLFAEEARAAQAGRNGGRQAVNLDAYPLARVPLETVRLLGTMTLGKQVIAVVSAGSDAPRRVKAGDYIGQNGGRILSIRPATDKNEAEMLIKETVQEKGSWVDREVRLTSSGQGEQK
ncbi:hypothetical protein DLREEDagrD3_01640 [Denitratisoma sp. agr-D3]